MFKIPKSLDELESLSPSEYSAAVNVITSKITISYEWLSRYALMNQDLQSTIVMMNIALTEEERDYHSDMMQVIQEAIDEMENEAFFPDAAPHLRAVREDDENLS